MIFVKDFDLRFLLLFYDQTTREEKILHINNKYFIVLMLDLSGELLFLRVAIGHSLVY